MYSIEDEEITLYTDKYNIYTQATGAPSLLCKGGGVILKYRSCLDQCFTPFYNHYIGHSWNLFYSETKNDVIMYVL